MKWVCVAAIACACKDVPPDAKSAEPVAARAPAATPAPALPLPELPLERRGPSDRIVDLYATAWWACVTRASGNVDCWNGSTPSPLGVDGARFVRGDHAMRCIVDAAQITCDSQQASADLDYVAPTNPPPGNGSRGPDHVVFALAGATDFVYGFPSCALGPDHVATCWNPDDDDPKPLGRLAHVRSLAGDRFFTCAVLDDGSVQCAGTRGGRVVWLPLRGAAHVKQLVIHGEDTPQPPDGKIARLAQAYAERDDGRVHEFVFDGNDGTWPGGFQLGKVERDEDIPDYARASSLTLNGDTLEALEPGLILLGTDGQTFVDDAVKISGNCVLRAQGSVVCWGAQPNGQAHHAFAKAPVTVLGVNEVVQISFTTTGGWAVRRDGTVFAWGNDHPAWAEQVAGLRDIAEVVAAPDARFAPCFVRRDRGVTCAGRDLGLHDVVALRVVDDSSSAHGHYVAWLPDGSARAFDVGDPKSMLVIPAAQRAVDYSGDDRHYCTVDARGQVACGGSTCKDGTCTAPTLAPVVEHARSVATFGATSCALLADGTVSCWGANIGGALGRIPGDAWNRGERDDMKDWPPGLVSGVHDAVQLRAYELGFCVAVRDGSLACWGTLSELNRDGHLEQVLPPGSLDGPFVGGTDGCTLRKNGLVACWGRNAAGRLGDGSIAKLVMPAAVPGLD